MGGSSGMACRPPDFQRQDIPMKSLLLSLAAAGALLAAPAIAQDHPDHHPAAEAAAPAKAMDMSKMTDAEMHAHCKSEMGGKMMGKAEHNHGADKGAPVAGKTTPPSAAEMKKMHEKCAAMMADDKTAKAK